jgi:ATP-dependent Clp protease ATP-binding subunit ClpA
MAQYSPGVIMVWGLAGAEAQAAGHETLEPGHLFITDLADRLRDRQIDIHLSPPVYELLLEHGHSPAYGAREMERAVESLIVQPLGKALLQGEFKGGDRLEVVVSDGLIHFQRSLSVEPRA